MQICPSSGRLISAAQLLRAKAISFDRAAPALCGARSCALPGAGTTRKESSQAVCTCATLPQLLLRKGCTHLHSRSREIVRL